MIARRGIVALALAGLTLGGLGAWAGVSRLTTQKVAYVAGPAPLRPVRTSPPAPAEF